MQIKLVLLASISKMPKARMMMKISKIIFVNLEFAILRIILSLTKYANISAGNVPSPNANITSPPYTKEPANEAYRSIV